MFNQMNMNASAEIVGAGPRIHLGGNLTTVQAPHFMRPLWYNLIDTACLCRNLLVQFLLGVYAHPIFYV